MKYFGYYAKIGMGDKRELHLFIEAPNEIEAAKKLLKKAGYGQDVADEAGGWKALWEESLSADEEVFDLINLDQTSLEDDGTTILGDYSW